MINTFSRLLSLAIAVGVVFFTATAGAYTQNGTTYYFSMNGDDTNSGLSPDAAKKTLTALQDLLKNAVPGDMFLLKRGDTWTKRADVYGLDIAGVHGTQEDPIVIGAYGEGA